jgi:hypothetical protein
MYLRNIQAILRGIEDTRCMEDTICGPCCRVPSERQKLAERWRLAGVRLKQLAPEMCEQVLATIIMSLPTDSEDEDAGHNQNYFSA